MNKLLILFIVFLLACSKPENQRSEFEAMNETYVNAWLANDSATILRLFEKGATLAPSGIKPMKGLDQITNFWFPNDSSLTTIHAFTGKILNTQVEGEFAYTTQKTFLSWSYQKGDFKMAKDQRGIAMTIYRKQPDGNWKIMHQMWKDVEVIDK